MGWWDEAELYEREHPLNSIKLGLVSHLIIVASCYSEG